MKRRLEFVVTASRDYAFEYGPPVEEYWCGPFFDSDFIESLTQETRCAVADAIIPRDLDAEDIYQAAQEARPKNGSDI